MNIPQYLALGVFSSYFLVILGLFWLIYQSLPPPSPEQPKLRIAAFAALAIGSLVHTWFCESLCECISLLLIELSLRYVQIYFSKHPASLHSYLTHKYQWSFVNFESQDLYKSDIVIERISSWLLNTSLFEEAWASVCVGALNWWWSEQLCLFTVGAWTVFLATKGQLWTQLPLE
jgi:hypothetical protein